MFVADFQPLHLWQVLCVKEKLVASVQIFFIIFHCFVVDLKLIHNAIFKSVFLYHSNSRRKS